MKNAYQIILGFLLITSCNQKSNSKKKNEFELKDKENLIEISIDSSLIINDINEEDFEIIKSTDTISYIKQLYEGIDGKSIVFDKKSFNSINARIKFEFSFIQYTIDDNPAYPISYSKQSHWNQLKSFDGKIDIPDFYGNTENIRVHELLNYSNFEEFQKSFNQDFKVIKRESISEQTKFYKNLVQNKSSYEKCCPEYINQAETFLKTKVADFNSIGELGLELYYKSIVIEVTGKLINGGNFKRIIIGK